MPTWSSVYSMPLSSQICGLFVLDRAGGVGDVGLAVAEQLETVAGAGTVDRDADAGVLGTELLGHEGADGLHRRRPGDHDVAGCATAAGGVPVARRTTVVAARGGQRARTPPELLEATGGGWYRNSTRSSLSGRAVARLTSGRSVEGDRTEAQVSGQGRRGEQEVNATGTIAAPPGPVRGHVIVAGRLAGPVLPGPGRASASSDRRPARARPAGQTGTERASRQAVVNAMRSAAGGWVAWSRLMTLGSRSARFLTCKRRCMSSMTSGSSRRSSASRSA